MKKSGKIVALCLTWLLLLGLFVPISVQAAEQQITVQTTASSTTVYDNEATTLDMQITGKPLAGITVPCDVVLVLDCSSSMSSNQFFPSMKAAAKNFVDLVDFSEHRVGVVGYSNVVTTCPITDDATVLKNFIDGLQCSGSTATDDAIQEATTMLGQTRAGATPTLVLLSDGYADNQSAAKAMADIAKNDNGITIFTVVLLGSTDMQNPEASSAYQSLKEISTSGGHHHFTGPDGVMGVYAEIEDDMDDANPQNVVITETIAPEFELVPGSTDNNIPQPTISGNTLVWNIGTIPKSTFHLTLQIKPKAGIAKGSYNHITDGKIEYLTYDGNAMSIPITPISVMVDYSPVITSISETQFGIAGGDTVTITGEHFETGASVTVGGKKATNIVVVDENTIQFTMPAQSQGDAQVTVTNPNKKSASVSVHFMAEPVVTALTPNSGDYAGGTRVHFDCQYILDGAKVTFDGQEGEVVGICSNAMNVLTPFIGKTGAVDVVVTNPDGTTITLPGAYTYNGEQPKPAPVVTKLSVTSGNVGEAKQILISGKNFRTGAEVQIGGEKATFVSMTTTTIKVKAPTTLAAGTYDVTVTNEDGTSGSLAGAYTYNAVQPKPAPVVTKLSVTSGNVGEAKQILISGKNFRTGAEVQIGGEKATFVSMTTTTIKVKAPTTLAAGTYDVTVTNEDGTSGSLAGAYTYNAVQPKPAPVVTKLSVTSGNVGEAKQILISGKNFRTGAEVQIGGEKATFVSMTTTTIKVKAPTTLAAGTYDVTVTNEDGTSGNLSNAYTYK